MFGPKLTIKTDKITVHLRPHRKDEMEKFAEDASNIGRIIYTLQKFGKSIEDMQEWYDRVRTDKDGVYWAIQPEGSDVSVGNTDLYSIDKYDLASTSGIMIFDDKWQGRGVGSAAHLARTWYANKVLNRATISSGVSIENPASYKALERVGYHRTGVDYAAHFQNGAWRTIFTYRWYNPRYLQMLFGDHVPEDILPAVERAKTALALAERFVTFG